MGQTTDERIMTRDFLLVTDESSSTPTCNLERPEMLARTRPRPPLDPGRLGPSRYRLPDVEGFLAENDYRD
jgi:hypothetical protein